MGLQLSSPQFHSQALPHSRNKNKACLVFSLIFFYFHGESLGVPPPPRQLLPVMMALLMCKLRLR